MILKKIIANVCNKSYTSQSITSIDCCVFIGQAVFLPQQNLIIFSNALSAKNNNNNKTHKKKKYIPGCLARKRMKNEPLKLIQFF